jgi:hypothetical protein
MGNDRLFRTNTLLVVVGLCVSGCLPFGNRSEPTELFPADSVSRQIAEEIEPLALEIVFRLEPDSAAYFGSIQRGPDSLIWIGDLYAEKIHRFTESGDWRPAIRSPELKYPYLSGGDADTVYVYEASDETLLGIHQETVVRHETLPVRVSAMNLSRSVLVFGGALYVKDTGSLEGATLAISSSPGRSAGLVRVRLPGPSWHYHGIMRPWLGQAAAASGYQPQIYLFSPSAGTDSLRLRGFDSPMLARSRAFALGEVEEPPLMISSISPVDSSLYVLNVRPGVVRIDEYDVKGLLTRVFEWSAPEPESFTPVDMLVTTDEEGLPMFFVVSTATDYGALSLQYRSRFDRFAAVEPVGHQTPHP